MTELATDRLILRRWRDPADDFDHPRIGIARPLRPHVLYRARA